MRLLNSAFIHDCRIVCIGVIVVVGVVVTGVLVRIIVTAVFVSVIIAVFVGAVVIDVFVVIEAV